MKGLEASHRFSFFLPQTPLRGQVGKIKLLLRQWRPRDIPRHNSRNPGIHPYLRARICRLGSRTRWPDRYLRTLLSRHICLYRLLLDTWLPLFTSSSLMRIFSPSVPFILLDPSLLLPNLHPKGHSLLFHPSLRDGKYISLSRRMSTEKSS